MNIREGQAQARQNQPESRQAGGGAQILSDSIRATMDATPALSSRFDWPVAALVQYAGQSKKLRNRILRSAKFRGIPAQMLATTPCFMALPVVRGVAMISKLGSGRDLDDIDDDVDDSVDDTIVIDTDDEDDDNVGDLSVELNIEELVAKLEATDDDNLSRKREIRRRLEELREQREAEREIDSTYNFSLDDD